MSGHGDLLDLGIAVLDFGGQRVQLRFARGLEIGLADVKQGAGFQAGFGCGFGAGAGSAFTGAGSGLAAFFGTRPASQASVAIAGVQDEVRTQLPEESVTSIPRESAA
jgi:hypothetical protein